MGGMALSTQPYKGARDFYPEDKRLQKYLFKTMRQTVEHFGYEEYDAPIIEPLDIYLAKTSEEVVTEQTYAFEDRGGRKVTLRPEMTPSVSRLVAGRRQELAYPLRWYSIPNLWRYERPQRGRLREHWQLNVDIFGVEGLEAEHEMITLADSLMKAFGAKHEMFSIRINSRQLVDMYLKAVLKLDQTQTLTLIRLIDRIHKLDHAEFIAKADAIFTPGQRETGVSNRLFDFLNCTKLSELPADVRDLEPAGRLARLMAMLEKSHILNAVFDASLMRGFDYYTDIVFEVFDKHPDNNRSMFGGGRYDGLVAEFGVDPVPTVGFGMGDVTLQNFLEAHDLLPSVKPELEVYAVLIGDVYLAAQPYIVKLREAGVKVAVDSTGRKTDKQLRTADKKQAPFVMFIGEKEIEDERFAVKNLISGQEEKHTIDRLVSIIKDRRNKK